MNPTITTTDESLPPPPPQPPRNSTSYCDRHPDEHFTGFCPCCLFERLSILDQSANATSSSNTSAPKSSSIKSLFKDTLRGRPSSSSFLPELRRTKSFSGGKNNEGFSGLNFEPQRRSCDVRGRSTLFSLFNQKDDVVPVVIDTNANEDVQQQVVEEEEEEEEGEFHESNDNVDEIEVVKEEEGECSLKVEILSEEKDKVELKTMKDHIGIDIHSQNKKVGSKDFKDIAGSLWSSAASVFSKKVRAWTRKSSKIKNQNGSHAGSKKGKVGRNYRDTQSEIADYGYGRRSCDTDPRLSFDVGRFSVDAGRYSVDAGRYSVDAGRISFDDARCSFDEPRASWDGYLIGGRTAFPRMMPPMVSVVEDAPVVVSRKDGQIPVEEPRRSSVSINGDECMPGGVAQTKDYYSDSSSRRRKSLDRSSSIRKTAAAVVAEMDEVKANASNNNGNKCTNSNGNNGCNAKISPGSLVGERDSRDLSSLRDDSSERFDLGFRDNPSMVGNGEKKGSKKSARWRAWNIWGLIYRRGNAKDEEDDRYSRANGVERSLSESWPEFRNQGYGDPRASFNRNVYRSNSSTSWRNSYNVGGSGSFGSLRKGSVKKSDEFVLERNRSAKYSPNHHADNGMLRFYLTPMKGSRRGSSGKPKPAYSHSFARSVMRLY